LYYYFFKTFDEENYLNKKGESSYLFTTEGHLYPINYAYKLRLRNGMMDVTENISKSRPRKSENSCKPSDRFYRMKQNLPMKMRYFDQLFEMVGVNDNLEHLLERKKT
jgi:hypothetical protein